MGFERRGDACARFQRVNCLSRRAALLVSRCSGYTAVQFTAPRTTMEKSDLSHHILSRYNDDLERVRTNVLQMGGFVEEQLKQAVEALVQGDSRMGELVARGDAK